MKKHNISEKLKIRECIREYGRMHFDKEIERRLFFFLTVTMLVLGLLAKLEIW